MADQEMIDRVAKAIRERDSQDEFAIARAAIKAMRELSYDLIDAGDIQVEFDGSFELAWHKTIDAVLND